MSACNPAAKRKLPFGSNDKIILLGELNARDGRNHDVWQGVIGHHGIGILNSSHLRLHSLCYELSLAITNIFFQLRDMHNTSWMHPRSKHWLNIFSSHFTIFLSYHSLLPQLPPLASLSRTSHPLRHLLLITRAL